MRASPALLAAALPLTLATGVLASPPALAAVMSVTPPDAAGHSHRPSAGPHVRHHLVIGWASIGPGMPVRGARIVMLDSSGRRVAGVRDRTGRSGQFTLDLGMRPTPPGAIVVARGGTVHREPLHGRLRAHAVSGYGHPVVNLTPATTVAVAWRQAHVASSWSKAEARARWGLGIFPGHDIGAGMRLGLTDIDHVRLHRRASITGYDAWAERMVHRIDAGKALRWAAPTVSRSTGGTAATLTWQLVQDAAADCGSSDIPGVGYLASAIENIGVLQQQCDTGWQQMLNDLDAIEATLTAMSTQVVDLNDDIAALNSLVATEAFSQAEKTVINDITVPIQDMAQSYENLAQEASDAVQQLGVGLPGITAALSSSAVLDDTVTAIRANASVQTMQTNAKALLDPGSSQANSFRIAVGDLQAAGFVMDGGAVGLGALHQMWLALRTPLLDGGQLAQFDAYVSSLREANAQAAAMYADWMRSQENTPAQIQQYLDAWNPRDDAFEALLLDPLPCPPASSTTLAKVEGPFCGSAYSVSMRDFVDMRTPASAATLPGELVTLPVLDPTSGHLWSLACAGVRGGMTLSSCPVTGILSTSTTLALAQPNTGVSEGWYWFETPLTSRWVDSAATPTSLPLARPTAAQLASLRSLAQSHGQTSSTTGSWLSKQSANVFGDAASLPAPVSGSVGYDCGWYDYEEGYSYFTCGSSSICNTYSDPDWSPYYSCQGNLAYAGLMSSQWIGSGVASSPLAWGLINDSRNNAWNCDATSCPPPPDNAYGNISTYAGGNSLDESQPPNWYDVSPYALPLAVATVDASKYQPDADSFLMAGS